MKIETKVIKTQTIKLSESDIENILRMDMVEQFGSEWNEASYSLYRQLVPTYMGQIEDEYVTEAYFKLKDKTE